MIVELKNIVKSYDATPVLKDLSFTVGAGELFFLIGSSGCGKSTLLRLIAGLLEPDSGQLFFDGRDVTNLPAEKREIGLVFQNYALWPHMTVFENVAFGLQTRKMKAAVIKEKVENILSQVRLNGFEQRFPAELSGGQQQRVALARALVIEPGLVLLDEPLSNLDAGLRLEMRAEIRRLHNELGLTMIYVTHDQKEALSLSDRLAVLHEGRLEQVGSPREIYSKPASRFVAGFVGETNFIKGKFTKRLETGWELETPFGLLELPNDRVFGAAEGKAAEISLRPECLKLGGSDFTAEILENNFLGETSQLVIEAAKLKLQALVLRESGNVSVGDKLEFGIEKDGLTAYGE